jgi:uncharacterized protein YjbI with pentapeptide repeats
LRGANFDNADFVDGFFSTADLRLAEFPDAKLQRAVFRDANLNGAQFPEADLNGAQFSDANLRLAEFPDADLRETQFSDADLSSAEFSDANLRLAEFLHADLRRAEFPHADLSGAEFHDADLRRAEFSDADLRRAEFSDADFRLAKFRDADVFGANFRHANLQETVFTSTDCREATFTSALLYETAFEDSRLNSQTTFYESNTSRPVCVYEENELTTEKLPDDVHPLKAARWVYRRLETLHEENALSEEARNFHISKEEAERKLYKERGNRRRHVKTLMWALTNHGESVRRLLGWWAAIIIGAGLLFPFVGGIKDSNGGTYAINSLAELGTWAGWNDLLINIYFSIITFSTIGYGDLSPAAPGSRVLVAFESITGALLLALLIFVLGRRVAR